MTRNQVAAQSGVVSNVVHHPGFRYATLTEPHRPWSAVTPVFHHCTEPTGSKAVFPQLPSRLNKLIGPAVEDHPQEHNAFYLNVSAPRSGQQLPVLVFIHGGAWSTGGGAVRWYHGGGLAASGIVVVTVNYRLGPAGHLRFDDASHAPMDELILALQWVNRFIGYYGGDPLNVTIAGQSAGAWYAWALAQEPRAAGLLQRAVLWSLPQIQPWSFAQRRHFTHQVLGEASEAATTAANYHAVMLRGNEKLTATPFPSGAMTSMYLPAERRPRSGVEDAVGRALQRLHVHDIYVRHTAHEMTPFLPLSEQELQVSETLAALGKRSEHYTGSSEWTADLLNGDGSAYDQMVAHATWESYGKLATTIASAGKESGFQTVYRQFLGESAVGLGSPHCFDLPFQFNNVENWYDAPMLNDLESSVVARWSAELKSDLLEFMHGEASLHPKELGT